ncbi:MAG: superinfection immunity protein [Candidatus Nanopelagicales bacterium]|nr:superinfection immunity protein [Candidatus Nanopelagicales bacterium]
MSEQVVAITDQESKPTQTIIAWICAVLSGLYLLPWAIAATRGKANSGMIGWINLLLGWTIIGYIWALVLSLTAHGIRQVSIVTSA